MADYIRGLEIRIGADTTKLSQALKAVNSALSTTQSYTRKLSKALMFDDTNSTVARKQMELLGIAAQEAENKLTQMRGAYAELGATKYTVDGVEQSVAELAAKTNKAGLEADEATSRWSRMNGVVAAAKDNIRAMYESLTGKKLHKNVGEEDIQKLLTATDEAKKKMNALVSEFDQLKAKKKSVAEVKEEIQKLYASVTGKELEVLPGGKFNSSVLERAKEGVDEYSREVSEAVANLEQLRAKQAEANADLDITKQVAAYEQMGAAIVEAEAEVRRLSAEQAAMYFPPELKSRVDQLNQSLAIASSDTERLKERFEILDGAVNSTGAKLTPAGWKEYYSSIRAQITTTENKIETLENAIREMEHTADTNLAKAKSDFEQVTQEINEQVGKLDAAKKTLKEYEDVATSGKTKEEIEKQRAEVDRLEKELGELETEAKVAQNNLDRAFETDEVEELRNEVIRLQTELAELNNKGSLFAGQGGLLGRLQQTGIALSATLTPYIQMFGQFAVQAADDIDSAYRDMRKTVDGTEEDFEHLKDAAEEFSMTHVTSADQILEIEAMGGQLGIAVEHLEEFAEVVSNIEIATVLDADTVSQQLGQLSGIMDDMNDEQHFDEFGDALVRLGNNSATTEDRIMNVMMRVASLGNLSDFSTPELLALSTAVASTGQGAEAAGTAIAKTFSNIEAAVGSGGDKLEAFAEVAGMSAEEFADTWQGEPMVAFTAFIDGLKAIDDRGDSVDVTLSNLGITAVRQKQALEGLTTTTDILHDSTVMAQDAWDGLDDEWGAAGDASREAQRKAEGFSGALQILKNNAQVFAADLMESVAPILSDIASLIGELNKLASGLSDSTKQKIVAAILALGATGPTLNGLVSVIRTFRSVSSAAFGAKLVGKILSSERMMRTFTGTTADAFREFAASSNAAATSGKTLTTTNKAVAESNKLVKTTAMSAKVALGGMAATAALMAVVAIIGIIVSKVEAYREHQEKLAKSTQKFDDINRRAASTMRDEYNAANGASDAFDDLGSHINTTKENTDALNEALDENISMYDSIEDGLNRAFASNYTIEGLAADIERLMGLASSGDISEFQIEELAAQIDALNAATGMNLELVSSFNDETGEWEIAVHDLNEELGEEEEYSDLSAAAIRRMAEAQKYAIMQTAYAQVAADAYAQQLKNNTRLAEAQATRDELLAQADQALADDNMDLYFDLMERADAAQATVDEIEALTQADRDAAESAEALAEFMGIAGSESADAFTRALADSEDATTALGGDIMDFWETVETLGIGDKLVNTEGAIDNLAAAWGGGTQSIIDGLKAADVAIDGNVLKTLGLKEQVNEINGKTYTYYLDDNGTIYDAQGNVIELQTEVDDLTDEDYTVDLSVSVDDSQFQTTKKNLDDWVSKAQTKFINVVERSMPTTGSASGGFIPMATGGYMPLSYHADGYIADTATLASIANGVGHIVGEAGAEAVIPLTNKRYSGVFADTLAERMVERMGGGGTYIYLNDVLVNDTPAIREATKNYLIELKRASVL